jgi:hypothetical protein
VQASAMSDAKKTKMTKWDAEAHEQLLFAILALDVTIDWTAVLKIYNPEMKLGTLREHIRLLKLKVGSGGTSPTKGNVSGSSPSVTPKKRKSPVKKPIKKPRFDEEDDQDEGYGGETQHSLKFILHH